MHSREFEQREEAHDFAAYEGPSEMQRAIQSSENDNYLRCNHRTDETDASSMTFLQFCGNTRSTEHPNPETTRDIIDIHEDL